MSLMDSIRTWWFSMTSGFDPPDVQARSSFEDNFIARTFAPSLRSTPWRTASTAEALGVPAIFSAVTLIANSTGSLSMKAFQRGRELPDDERPRIIVRPNPFTTPRDFYRDTAYSMAVYGEAWWWVAARDFDDLPLSLIPVNPREIKVEENPRDLRYPIITWRGKKMPNADMKQITYLRDPGELRGFGPLQKCGAAVSISVEAQEWAANFYADGGKGGTTVKVGYEPGTEEDDDGYTEADRIRNQWIDRAHNSVRVIGPSIEDIDEHEPNEAGAQMLQSRAYNAVETAQMFNMPAPMIEAAVAGSSLTYQNIPSLYDSFARRCLSPNYLEPIEQTMSDLLTRQTVSRFNTEGLFRLDPKARWEIYEIQSRVIGQDDAATIARQKEGIDPGDVEFAPVPFAVPQAVPTEMPTQSRSESPDVRCDGMATKRKAGATRIERCNRLLSRSGSFVGQCPRCKKDYAVAA